MDQITNALEPCKQFAKDSMRLVKRCTKPDRKEFQKIALATAIGFAIMGFIGFFCQTHSHPHQQHHSAMTLIRDKQSQDCYCCKTPQQPYQIPHK
mmetsp:Transcript_40974/g.67786  ORF Transcript_40974/g.67786 Transcript_40974/m.67786 type:complete len:95 (+) Transcript_40974:66-350(+)